MLVAAPAGARSDEIPASEDMAWPVRLEAALTSCAATQCADADDGACASTCEATRTEAPICREVDCSECLEGASECASGDECSERVCVLCGWPERGELLGACRAASASKVSNEDDRQSARPAWALYELKDHRYHLLLAAGERVAAKPVHKVTADSPSATKRSLRDRIGGMGILALIGAARAGNDGAVASIFSSGSSVDDRIRSSLDTPAPVYVEIPFVDRGLSVWARGASDPGDLSTHSGRALPAHAKRASTITARVANDDLIDIDGQQDTSHVARVLQQRKEAFRLCYEHALKSNHSLAGRILLDFDVSADGRVARAALVRDDVASPQLARCVLGTLQRIRFPAQQGEERFVTASLSFERRQ